MTASTRDARRPPLHRIALAALGAPLAVVPLILVFTVAVVLPFGEPGDFHNALMLYMVFALLIAYPATLIAGVPLYFLLLGLGRHGYLEFFATGAALAAIIWFALLGVPTGAGLFEALFAVMLVLCGAVVAVAFRAIAGVGPRDGVALR